MERLISKPKQWGSVVEFEHQRVISLPLTSFCVSLKWLVENYHSEFSLQVQKHQRIVLRRVHTGGGTTTTTILRQIVQKGIIDGLLLLVSLPFYWQVGLVNYTLLIILV